MSNDLLSGAIFGNGLVAGATYDTDYRLSTLTLLNGATPVISLGYAYADKLNLTAVNDNVTSANSVSLWYDQARRLHNANGPWGERRLDAKVRWTFARPERHLLLHHRGRPLLRDHHALGRGDDDEDPELSGHLEPHLHRHHKRHRHPQLHP